MAVRGQAEQAALCQELEVFDTSLGFLLILLASVMLSFWASAIQRRALALTICCPAGQAPAAPEVYPLRRCAGAMVIGALGFFFCLSARTARQARGDCSARRAAQLDLWASALVLLAALLRFAALRPTGAGTEGDSALPD